MCCDQKYRLFSPNLPFSCKLLKLFFVNSEVLSDLNLLLKFKLNQLDKLFLFCMEVADEFQAAEEGTLQMVLVVRSCCEEQPEVMIHRRTVV